MMKKAGTSLLMSPRCKRGHRLFTLFLLSDDKSRSSSRRTWDKRRNKKDDTILVKVEPLPHVPTERYGELGTQLANELRYKIGVGIKVEIVPPNALPRYEVKAKRVFDHRKKQ